MNGNLELVKSEVEKELGINTKIISCSKNGINLEGICFLNDSGCSPIIYYHGEPIGDFVNMAKEAFRQDRPKVDIEVLKDKEYVLKNCRLAIQRQTDDPILKRSCLNLELYIRLKLSATMSVKITKDLLTLSGLTGYEVWKAAKANTERYFDITNMEELMGLMGVGNVPHLFDVVTNYERMHGAVALAFPDLFRQYCMDRNLDSVVLLPSSIHELLLLEDDNVDYMCLAEMVQSVNEAEVSPFEQLDPVTYRYDLATNEISIVAAYER